MSTSDATFLWETEALRESARRRHQQPLEPEPSSSGSPPTDAEWVTLRRGHEATGIPVETLRKWARRGAIPSHLDEGANGARRMIRLDDVKARARELGRPIAPIEPRPEPRDVAPPAPTVEPAAPATAAVGLDDASTEAPAAGGGPEPAVVVTVDPAEPREETMIVPVAAWDKMLMQLGNLHEAGQQLAEARERAAKAETENRFLRERLADLRNQEDRSEPDPAATTGVEEPPAEPAAPMEAAPIAADLQEPRPLPGGRGQRLMRSLRRWRIEVRRS